MQAPQDHRDWKGDRFKEMLNWEYAGFFDIGMCLRNEYDAIIQHGTMTLVRRDLMEELGGWATWCITEDTELGLRLMEKGYGAMYSRERFGHGLTPDHFAGYKKQRFRWAYGAMQIMKAHAGKMLGNSTKLTFWQKYHFVAGWMPWFADALNLIFTWAGLAWLLAVLLPPLFGIKPVGLPPAEFILPTIGIFVFKLLYSFGLYFDRVRCTFRQSVGASLAGLALTYTVGRAVIYGLATSRLPFMRTPKMDERATLGMALGMARGEAVLTILLWLRRRSCCGWAPARSIPRRGCGRSSWSCSRCPMPPPSMSRWSTRWSRCAMPGRCSKRRRRRPMSPARRCSPHSRSWALFPVDSQHSSVSVWPCPRLNPPARPFS